MEVAIAINHRLVHPAEQAKFRGAESIGGERVNYPANPRIGIVNLSCLEATCLAFGDLFGSEPEYVHILAADFFQDLDVGSVEGSHRESAVHRKLHVA